MIRLVSKFAESMVPLSSPLQVAARSPFFVCLFVCWLVLFNILFVINPCLWFVGPCGAEPKWYNILRFRTTTFYAYFQRLLKTGFKTWGV